MQSDIKINNFKFDLPELNFSNIQLNIGEATNSRYCKPPKTNKSEHFVKKRNAIDFLATLDIQKDCRIHAIIDGSFVFFDLIVEMVAKYQRGINKMSISTLSLSQDNIVDMAVLLENGWVKELNLIVSDYFYSHERHQLVNFIYESLDFENRFQFAVSSTHCKILTFIDDLGLKFVIHGSANLRSSGNIEQICIEQNDQLYDFYEDMQDKTIEKYKTIEKSIIKGNLWKAIN